MDVLLNIESQKRQVEQKRNPIPIDKEEESQETMDGSFRDDVCVETVAEVDGVDVVTANPMLAIIPCTAKSMQVCECLSGRDWAYRAAKGLGSGQAVLDRMGQRAERREGRQRRTIPNHCT